MNIFNGLLLKYRYFKKLLFNQLKVSKLRTPLYESIIRYKIKLEISRINLPLLYGCLPITSRRYHRRTHIPTLARAFERSDNGRNLALLNL